MNWTRSHDRVPTATTTTATDTTHPTALDAGRDNRQLSIPPRTEYLISEISISILMSETLADSRCPLCQWVGTTDAATCPQCGYGLVDYEVTKE